MTIDDWDPLAGDLPPDFQTATIKRGILNILKSYTGWYDLLSELIQNALDATDQRKRRETEYSPKLWIKINLQANSISVTDNGIGFSGEHFKYFLAPMVSFKSKTDRGQKGVGATYLAYGFNFLQIGTKTPDFTYVGTIKDGREWVEDDEGARSRPNVSASDPIHDVFNDIDKGSTFTLKLEGPYIRPADLRWTGASTANQWEIILRIKTPLGGIYGDAEYNGPICFLEVIDSDGNCTRKEIKECKYLFPNEAIKHCISYDEILQKKQELIAKHKDPNKLPSKYYKLNGIFGEWKTTEILSAEFGITLSEEEKAILTEFGINFYGSFIYSTSVWDEFNDRIAGLRQGMRILKGGIQLAGNYMPQGEILIIPLTRNIGYQHLTHVLAHFEKADPDLGRKGFQPELVALAQKIAVRIVSILQGGKAHLLKETGARPAIEKEKEIHEWVKEQEIHEKEFPLIISREDVFLPGKKPLITSKPLNEQDVVSLFNQLLAGGVIRGVKIMATNQHKQYDGICRCFLQKPLENHIFDLEHNPLGLESINVKEFDTKPFILEYKYTFDALIEEFENEDKSEKEIDLVVAWKVGSNWAKRYQITPLLQHDNLQHRFFHGGTHLVINSMTGDTVFPMIIISELIDYINDPESQQEYQKKSYIDA